MSQFYFFGIHSTWQVTQAFGKLLNLSKSIQSKMIQRIQWMIQHNKCLEFPLSHTVKFKVDRHLRRTKKLTTVGKWRTFAIFGIHSQKSGSTQSTYSVESHQTQLISQSLLLGQKIHHLIKLKVIVVTNSRRWHCWQNLRNLRNLLQISSNVIDCDNL